MKLFGSLVVLTALTFSPGCASRDKSATRLFPWPDAKLQTAKLATALDEPGGDAITESKRRVVTQIRGNNDAKYVAFTGAYDLADLHPTTGPTVMIAAPGEAANSVQAISGVNFSESAVISDYPFFLLRSGFVYVVGTMPAAQTEHVIAGSESTKFIIEIDPHGETAEEKFIHRVYAVDAPAKMQVQAREGGQQVGKKKELSTGQYIEIKRDSGGWGAGDVKTITPELQGRVDKIRAAAKLANVE